MIEHASFITLDQTKYPAFANVPETIFVECERMFFAAQFYKHESIPCGAQAHICIFADTKFRLTVNGRMLGVGPIAAGGDYGNEKAMPVQYYNEYDVTLQEDFIDIFAEVQTPGEVMTDYSCGQGGFIFSADITCPDGTKTVILSDESWLVRQDTRYRSITEADYTVELPAWETPVVIKKKDAPWHLKQAGLPPLCEEIILPSRSERREKGIFFDFPRIYSAYIAVDIDNRSGVPQTVSLCSQESSISNNTPEIITVPCGKSSYRGFRMWSIGLLTVGCPADVDVKASLIYAHYPVNEDASGTFVCSDETLTKIYDLGRFTLEMCRQSLHLDSPRHQETLGCTGDYAIETLMTSMTFGDMRLSRLDLVRTAEYLRMSGGIMFHTSYSLIFVSMLHDYYMFTADGQTVRELLPTVELLFRRFATYIENHVIENPPNYMFIEWGVCDGYNLHHPPKALGQTAMNAYYQMALRAAAKLYGYVGDARREQELILEADLHKAACTAKFYDKEKGMFRDGESAPASQNEASTWLPANSEKTYHTRHASILSALCGFAPDGRALIEKVITTPEAFEDFAIQPYFMHYLMEAVRKYDLFDTYGIGLLHWWDQQLEASPKGMMEGWGKFAGDRSHAWGATPTYQLPMAVSGFEMKKAGFEEFILRPKLFSFEFADMSFPTPDGLVKIEQRKGEALKLSCPPCYTVLRQDDGVILVKK